MIDIVSVLETLQRHPIYLASLVFFAWYPIFSSALWVFSSILFFMRRERPRNVVTAPDYNPSVTILIAAFNEEDHIEQTIKGCLRIDYDNYEIVIVDDGSRDKTLEKIKPYADAGKIRVIRKRLNEGKAMALNDSIPYTNGEILLIIDADAIPDPKILRRIVPHFKSPRVGAVTGNPRVANRRSFLSKLQAIEFASIVSLQRRGARIWGKLLTMSGVVGAFHRTALLDVDMYSPDMATEDIDVTWKLQLRCWDIRYEPRAIVWMRVPVSIRGLWHQRRRWSKGLAEVLHRHGRSTLQWRARRLWPVMAESCLSILWAFLFVAFTVLWTISYSAGFPPVGASPIPNYWGMLIGTMCLIQLFVGVLLDRGYDKRLPWYYMVAVFYPLVYWILMALVSTVSTPGGMMGPRHKKKPVRWKPVREVG
jgi:biofilm PGA synthesis N-glycosyltransferase PgaC